ncbi:MAG: polyprenyl synthetase family protein [Candidatus Goldbacteria bacterium]|nr:polyprenyl synthetase family protein [Candidatus Goldiibacteriota bacterium]
MNRLIINLIKKINKNLFKYLKSKFEFPPIIYKAVRYSVFAGGKRIRPVLLLLTAKSCGLSFKSVMPVACGIEMIHTYSLIHDDLPAMDDDDYRRGKLTSHKKFGEAIAILAGDALLTKAFETICYCRSFFSPDKIISVIKLIADAAGINGMVGGQVADILFENKPISKKTLQFIHSHKTGALIKASILSGAILSDAVDDKELKLWDKLGEIVGMIFQITDDILDITSTTKKLGKTAGKDIKQKKATFPAVYGLDRSKQIVSNLLLEAKKILYKIKKPTEDILNLIEFIANRKN